MNALALLHPDDRDVASEVLSERGAVSADLTPVEAVDAMAPPSVGLRLIHRDGQWLACRVTIENRLADSSVRSFVVRIARSTAASGTVRVFELLAASAPTPEVVAAVVGCILGDAERTDGVDVVAAWSDGSGTHIGGSLPGIDAASPLVAPFLDAGDTGDAAVSRSVTDLPDGPTRRVAGELGYRRVWSLPVGEVRGRPLGTLIVWSKTGSDLDLRSGGHVSVARHLFRLALLEAERHRLIHEAATTDPLTGLGNRSSLRAAIDGTRGRVEFPVGAIFADLNRFNAVNDSLGHEVGDLVLAACAERLRRLARPDDTVARLGGDGFVFVRAGADESDLGELRDQIASHLSAPVLLGDPTTKSPTTVEIEASVGLAIAHDQSELVDLVARADRSLYEAKRTRRDLGFSAEFPADVALAN